jgi:hypothetical protein
MGCRRCKKHKWEMIELLIDKKTISYILDLTVYFSLLVLQRYSNVSLPVNGGTPLKLFDIVNTLCQIFQLNY